MAKKEITKSEYLQLTGLLTLAADHQKQIESLADATAELLGQEADGYHYYGRVSDDIWSGIVNPAVLLKELGIKVKK